MKILLTGKTGQVGWELQRALAPLAEVVAVDLPELDLTNPDDIRRVVREVRPNLIVNPAAHTAVDKAESEPAIAEAINAIAPAVFAEEAKALGAGLIHYSTDYVYDGTGERPYVETDPTNPLSVYGRTKLAGDQAIAASGVAHAIFRTSWVYGARGKNFMLTVMRLANEREELRIVADQFGAPTWCRMLAEATAALVARSSGPRAAFSLAEVSGVYHMTNAGRTSWHGFTQAIVDQARLRPALAAALKVQRVLPIGTADYPLPAPRPGNSLLDNSKLRDVLGLQLPDWQHSLERAFAEWAKE